MAGGGGGESSVDNFINSSFSLASDFTNKISFSLWFQSPSASIDDHILCKITDGATTIFDITLKDDSSLHYGSFTVNLTGGSENMITPQNFYYDDEIVFLTFSFNGSTAYFYRNGTLFHSTNHDYSGNFTSGADKIDIPIRDPIGTEDFRIYSRALSLEEHRILYYSKGRDHIFNGLQHRYLFTSHYPGESTVTTSNFYRDVGPQQIHLTSQGTNSSGSERLAGLKRRYM